MSDVAEKEITLEEVVHYANVEALAAVASMPRGYRKLKAFHEAWSKAVREYIRSEDRKEEE